MNMGIAYNLFLFRRNTKRCILTHVHMCRLPEPERYIHTEDTYIHMPFRMIDSAVVLPMTCTAVFTHGSVHTYAYIFTRAEHIQLRLHIHVHMQTYMRETCMHTLRNEIVGIRQLARQILKYHTRAYHTIDCHTNPCN